MSGKRKPDEGDTPGPEPKRVATKSTPILATTEQMATSLTVSGTASEGMSTPTSTERMATPRIPSDTASESTPTPATTDSMTTSLTPTPSDRATADMPTSAETERPATASLIISGRDRFPAELAEKLLNGCSITNYRVLALACKFTNVLVDPYLWSAVIIDTARMESTGFATIREIGDKIRQHTEALTFHVVAPYPGSLAKERLMERCFQSVSSIIKDIGIRKITFTPQSRISMVNCNDYERVLEKAAKATNLELAVLPPAYTNNPDGVARLRAWIQTKHPDKEKLTDVVVEYGTEIRLVAAAIRSVKVVSLSLFGDPKKENVGVIEHFFRLLNLQHTHPIAPRELRVANLDCRKLDGRTVPISFADLKRVTIHECLGGRVTLAAVAENSNQLTSLSFTDYYLKRTAKVLPRPSRVTMSNKAANPLRTSKRDTNAMSTIRPTYDFEHMRKVLLACKFLKVVTYHVSRRLSIKMEDLIGLLGKDLEVLSISAAAEQTFEATHSVLLVEKCPRLVGLAIGVSPARDGTGKLLRSGFSTNVDQELLDIAESLKKLKDFKFLHIIEQADSEMFRSGKTRPDKSFVQDATHISRIFRGAEIKLRYLSLASRKAIYQPWDEVLHDPVCYLLEAHDGLGDLKETRNPHQDESHCTAEDRQTIKALVGEPIRFLEQFCLAENKPAYRPSGPRDFDSIVVNRHEVFDKGKPGVE